MIPAALGNMIGGAVFVAAVYWYLYLFGSSSSSSSIIIDGDEFDFPLADHNDWSRSRCGREQRDVSMAMDGSGSDVRGQGSKDSIGHAVDEIV
jgi:hypothetical protein